MYIEQLSGAFEPQWLTEGRWGLTWYPSQPEPKQRGDVFVKLQAKIIRAFVVAGSENPKPTWNQARIQDFGQGGPVEF